MAITLTSEQEAIVRHDAKQAGFASAEQYLASELESCHATRQLLAENVDELTAVINEGLDAADRGELLSSEEVKEAMAQMKREFFSKQNAA